MTLPAGPITLTITVEPETMRRLAVLCNGNGCVLAALIREEMERRAIAASRAEQPQDEREGR